MKRFSILLMLACVITPSALAENVKPANAAEAAYLAYVQAWKSKDLASLETLIADDYMTLNGEGKLSNKASELAEAKSDPPFDEMQIDEIHSLVVGNTAVVSGIISVSGHSQGKPFHVKTRVLATLLRRHRIWQLIADQSAQ